MQRFIYTSLLLLLFTALTRCTPITINSRTNPTDETSKGQSTRRRVAVTPSLSPTPTPDAVALTAPVNLTDGERASSLSDAATFSWDPVAAAASYEIAIGSTLGATDVVDWTNVGTSTTISKSGLSLTNGAKYYGSVRAVAADGSRSAVVNGDGWQNLVCPVGYVKILGNTTPGLGGPQYTLGTQSYYNWTAGTETLRSISDFCVMKYEAKLAASHTAVSVAAGTPWVSIPRQTAGPNNDAQEACENNGANYRLTSNNYWQAIARDIESVTANYNTTGLVADYTFSRGHADNGPANTLAASSNDALGCIGVTSNGDPADDCGGVWHVNRRTFTLKNGEVIWDFGGNVSEWVRDDNIAVQGVDAYMNTEPYTDRLKWGPVNNYTAQTGSNKAGLGYAWLNNSAGAVLRDGVYANGTAAGFFSVNVNYAPTTSSAFRGFRCVYAP